MKAILATAALLVLLGLPASAKDIHEWDPVASGNNDTAPDGFPEGMPRPDVNDAARETMAALRRFYENPEWLDLFWDQTVTRVDEDTFLVALAAGDQTGHFTVNRLVKLTGGGDAYCNVTASVWNGGTGTTVDCEFNPRTPAGLTEIPVGTNGVELHFAPSLGAAAYRDVGDAENQIPDAELALPAFVSVYNTTAESITGLTPTALDGMQAVAWPFEADGSRLADISLYCEWQQTALGAIPSNSCLPTVEFRVGSNDDCTDIVARSFVPPIAEDYLYDVTATVVDSAWMAAFAPTPGSSLSICGSRPSGLCGFTTKRRCELMIREVKGAP